MERYRITPGTEGQLSIFIVMTGISANGNEAGGAVFVEDNAAFHMTGGTVSANKASKGGGICIVDSALQRGIAEYGTEFLMDGGVISGNRAGIGGGIYSFSNGSFLRSGKIINNTATYSGGGLYSEGRSIDGYSTAHLYNAVVTENIAEQGGGLWFCATGMAELYIKDGIGIFDNKAVNTDGKAAGDDLVFRTISGNPRQFNYRDESSGVCISAQSK